MQNHNFLNSYHISNTDTVENLEWGHKHILGRHRREMLLSLPFILYWKCVTLHILNKLWENIYFYAPQPSNSFSVAPSPEASYIHHMPKQTTTVPYKPWLQSYIISFICAVVSLSIAIIYTQRWFCSLYIPSFCYKFWYNRTGGHVLSQMSDISTGIKLYHMARNISVELNLVAGKMNHVLPNFILPTFNTCNKISKCLLKHVYE